MTVQLAETTTTGLLSVVYSSAATVPFSDVDLAALLVQSRMRNDPEGLTGMLLHRDGQFMQAIEGPEEAVRRTLRRISADPRHTAVWTLSEERVSARRFGTWAMGYREPPAGEAPPQQWFGSPEAQDADPAALQTRAGELLAWFRQH